MNRAASALLAKLVAHHARGGPKQRAGGGDA